jgi:hypothetical protein
VSLVASTEPSRDRSQRSLPVSVGTTFRTDNKYLVLIKIAAQINFDLRSSFVTIK